MSHTALASRRARFSQGLALIALIAFPIGCGGDPNKPELGRVSGKVSYNGEPVPKGVVTFVPLDGPGAQTGQPATGEISSNGSYQLTTFDKGDGAVLGEHIVLVQSVEMDPSLEGGGMPIPNARGELDIQPPKHLVPETYSDTQRSPLRFTVASGRNTFDIELTDD